MSSITASRFGSSDVKSTMIFFDLFGKPPRSSEADQTFALVLQPAQTTVHAIMAKQRIVAPLMYSLPNG